MTNFIEMSRMMYRVFGGLSALMLLGAGCVAAPASIEPQATGTDAELIVIEDAQEVALPPETDADEADEAAEPTVRVIDEVTLEIPASTVEPASESAPESAPAIVSIAVTAKQFDFSPSVVTVNKGDTVRLTVTSVDVTHGLAIPAFGVSENLRPGETVTVEFTADKAGEFPFFCSVFCGEGHGQMRGTLIVRE